MFNLHENFCLSSGEEIEILKEINILEPPSIDFYDKKFPPKSESISKEEKDSLNFKVKNWLPISKISKKAQLFVNGTGESDVRQGSIGDCW